MALAVRVEKPVELHTEQLVLVTSETLATDLPRKRPERMQADVWAVLAEYVRDGGLFDYSENIASLAQMERAVRDDPGTPLVVKARLVAQLAVQAAEVKAKYLRAIETRKRFLALEEFAVVMEELTRILFLRIKDPVLVYAVGLDINSTLQRVLARLRRG